MELPGLAKAIQALRAELLQAWSVGEGERLRFKPEWMELTMEVVVTTDALARGGIKW